ncbi:MAG TPA: Rrf2 family transcriptional regulator [Thermopolyspora sp.]|jgi:rrf2 family protein (putative transcriptional regulator)
MRLSARVDYALRAAAELAAAGSGLTTVGELAKGQEMPPKYLENILLQMRRAGLVRGQRGPEGGYILARPANQITLADVIRAVDGPLANVRGERPEHVGYTGAAQSLQQVWIALRASERAILEEVTLEQIASGDLPRRVRELSADPAAWD